MPAPVILVPKICTTLKALNLADVRDGAVRERRAEQVKLDERAQAGNMPQRAVRDRRMRKVELDDARYAADCLGHLVRDAGTVDPEVG